MKKIENKSEFELEKNKIFQILHKGKELPEQVFSNDYNRFIVFESYMPFHEYFYENFKFFLNSINERAYKIAVLDPDPEEYFFRHYNKYPLIEVDNSDSTDTFQDIIMNYPGENTDVIRLIPESLLFYSNISSWAIYIHHGYELSIIAFKDKWVLEEFNKHLNELLIFHNKIELELYFDFLKIKPLEFFDTINKNYLLQNKP